MRRHAFQSTPPRGGRPTLASRQTRCSRRFQSTPPRGGRPGACRCSTGRCSSFNPRPRVGGDAMDRPMLDESSFQSTPPRGGRHALAASRLMRSGFQSTPPRGGRRARSARCIGVSRRFQSTPPRGGRRSASRELARMHASFNPRPRVGGDRAARASAGGWFQSTPPRGGRRVGYRTVPQTVSIHAPAWGATDAIGDAAGVSQVSIHAPAWGATCCRYERRAAGHRWFQSTPPRGGRRAVHDWLSAGDDRFNPRPREGGDDCPCGSVALHHDVSIHAPAWGATVAESTWSTLRLSFNPRPRVGGDVRSSLRRSMATTFQSTPPRGGRQ